MKSGALVSPPNIYPPGLKLTTKPFTGRTLRSLLIQMQNIGLQRSGCAESKETRQSWLLLLAFSPPLVFRFSCLFFFFRWRFSRLHFAGKRFWESFEDFRIRGRKDRSVVEQDFRGNFLVNVTWFFVLFSVWYALKDLFTLHRLVDKVVLDH